MDELPIPVASLLRLFRNAIISRQELRRQFFNQTIEREFQDIKRTHDSFRSILMTIKSRLNNLIREFPQQRKIVTAALIKIFDEAGKARNPNRTSRRVLYEECMAFLEISNPYKEDVLLVFDESEVVEIQTFMFGMTTYFEIDQLYIHEVSHALRDLEHLISQAGNSFNTGKDFGPIVRDISAYLEKLDGCIEQNEAGFALIARQYAKLRFAILRV